MSAFRPSGSGGGIDPAQLAALVDDSEAGNLYSGIVGAIYQRADAVLDNGNNNRLLVIDTVANQAGTTRNTVSSEAATTRARVDSKAAEIISAIQAGSIPSGFVGEFPANAVPAGYTVVQGLPADLPSGIGTVSSTRATGSIGLHRGFAVTATTQRLWSLYNATLQALDYTTNRYETLTYTLPFTVTTNPGPTLHDLGDNLMLITAGYNSASTLGNPAAYVFNATTRVFTQVTNMQWNIGGVNYSGLTGTSLRLADGRLFWMPSTLQHPSTSLTFINNYGTTGGYYGVYDPVSGSFVTGRLAGWETALAGSALGTFNSGINTSLPIGQKPSGRLLLQEAANTLTASRHFIIDFTMGYNAAAISLGTFNWSANAWALGSHPQGLVAFTAGATSRRYFNSTTGVMDAQNASVYSTASVSAGTNGAFYKALPIGNGNYAIPAVNASTEAYAYAFDGFVRLGTVRARKN